MSSLEQITKNCRFLQELSINGCPIQSLAPLFQNVGGIADRLSRLEIADCRLDSLAGIESARQLNTIRLSPRLLKDTSSIELLRSLPNLVRIYVDNSTQPTPASEFWRAYDEGKYLSSEDKGSLENPSNKAE